MDNQAKPDSLSSECSSVGGAVPTSPPRHTDECPSQTFEGASSPGVTLAPATCVCHRAAPTSTPLDALRERVEMVIACAERDCVVNPQFAGGLEIVIAMLREALAASPASALVTKDGI
jgi:hypothetical protein